jgi:hypothetical protein
MRRSRVNGQRITFDLPHEVIESIAELAAEIAAERLNLEPEPWIGVDEAADHLDCPRSRIYAQGEAVHRLPSEARMPV